MAQSEGSNSASLYLVEVSGWDSRQRFFVERCDLSWDEDCGKRVELSQSLPDNAHLFVRLLKPEDSERSHPVVYEAEWLGTASNGQQQFRLSAVVPIVREQEVTVG